MRAPASIHMRRPSRTTLLAMGACKSRRRDGAGRLGAGPKRLRGAFPEELTILNGEPAQMQESPSACDHRHRDRGRRVSDQFCTHMVQSMPPQIHHRRGVAGPLERSLKCSRADPRRSCQFGRTPGLVVCQEDGTSVSCFCQGDGTTWIASYGTTGASRRWSLHLFV